MKRLIGVILAVAMVLSFATACGGGENPTTTPTGSAEQGQGSSASSTTEQQGSVEMTTVAQVMTTPNPNMEMYPTAGEELSGDKMGYKSPEWIAQFGADKLEKSSDSGIVYTLGGYQEGIKPYKNMYEREHEGAAWYALPQLKADTEDAKNFNANMQAFANLLVRKNETIQGSTLVSQMDGANYVVYEYGNYVSIVLLYYKSEGRVDVEESALAVVYDKVQGRFLSWSEVMAATGATKADLMGIDKWFVAKDLYSERSMELTAVFNEIKHNYRNEASRAMFFVWSRLYRLDEGDLGLFPHETVIRRTLFDPMFEQFYFPEASLYVDGDGKLSIVGSHIELNRNTEAYRDLDVMEQRVKAASIENVKQEILSYEAQDTPFSELYEAVAKKVGIAPADGPNAFVIKLGMSVSPLGTEDNRNEGDKPEPMFQGVQDILKSLNPNGSLAEHVTDEIPNPFSMSGKNAFPLYLVIPKNKWSAVATSDQYNYSDFIALGAALVPTGENNANVLLRFRNEKNGIISADEEGILNFEGTSDFMDVTKFVTPNTNLDPEVQYLLQYYTPLILPPM